MNANLWKKTAREYGEPFVRIVRREGVSGKKAFLIRILAVVLALAAGGVLLLILGHNPFSVYANMVTGSLGSVTVRRETIKIAVPLLITAIAVALAFRMRFWNIGAEGQILAGAIAASYFALFKFDGMPRPLLLLVMCLAAVAAGGLMGVIPAFFKAKWGTNETLFTLMLNYIALGFVKYLQNGPWKSAGSGFPIIDMFACSHAVGVVCNRMAQ